MELLLWVVGWQWLSEHLWWRFWCPVLSKGGVNWVVCVRDDVREGFVGKVRGRGLAIVPGWGAPCLAQRFCELLNILQHIHFLLSLVKVCAKTPDCLKKPGSGRPCTS